MTEIVNLPDCARIFELESPGFDMGPPELHHRDIVPQDILWSMEQSWNLPSFTRRSITVSLLEDVYVVEEGLVFNAAGELYRESITQHGAPEIGRGHAVVSAAIAAGQPSETGSFVLCKKRGVHNFGHWLIEMLPKAHFAKLFAPIVGLRYVVPLVDGQLSEVIIDSLRLLGIDDKAVLPVGSEVVHFERLLIVDGLTHHGVFMSPLVFNCLDALSSRVRAAAPAKLYITRGDSPSRRFINDAVVRHRAEADGYRLIDPATLSFNEQVAAFKSATDIVGVMGAGLTNIAFAPAGTRVINLAPATMPDTFFWFIAGLRHQRYSEIRCRHVGPVRGVAPWDTELEVTPDDLDHIFSMSRQRTLEMS